MTRISGFLWTMIISIVLAACGGGGGGGDSGGGNPVPPNPTTPPPVVKDVTLRMNGGTIEASAGATFAFLVNVDCPRVSAGSARCAKVVGPMTLTLTSSGVTVSDVQFQLNGVPVGNNAAWNITDAGQIQVSATVVTNATVGQTGQLVVSATSANGTIEVVGTPTVLKVVHEGAKLSGATPHLFNKVGYGEMGGFDVTCPADTAPKGCKLVGMKQLLLPTGVTIPSGVQIDTFIGSVWWWQLETGHGNIMSGGEQYTLSSPLPIAAGATLRVSVRSALTQGSIILMGIDLVRVSDGVSIPLVLPPAPVVCSTILHGLVASPGCKG